MEKQWYFNTVTEQPELGMISPASHRMGPYLSLIHISEPTRH